MRVYTRVFAILFAICVLTQPILGASQTVKKEKTTKSVRTDDGNTQIGLYETVTAAAVTVYSIISTAMQRELHDRMRNRDFIKRVVNGAKVIGKKVVEKALDNPKTVLAAASVMGIATYVYNNHYDAISKWFVQDAIVDVKQFVRVDNATCGLEHDVIRFTRVDSSFFCGNNMIVCLLKSHQAKTTLMWNWIAYLTMHKYFAIIEKCVFASAVMYLFFFVYRVLAAQIENSPVCIELARASFWQTLLFFFLIIAQLITNIIVWIFWGIVTIFLFGARQCAKLRCSCKRNKPVKQEENKEETNVYPELTSDVNAPSAPPASVGLMPMREEPTEPGAQTHDVSIVKKEIATQSTQLTNVQFFDMIDFFQTALTEEQKHLFHTDVVIGQEALRAIDNHIVRYVTVLEHMVKDSKTNKSMFFYDIKVFVTREVNRKYTNVIVEAKKRAVCFEFTRAEQAIDEVHYVNTITVLYA